MSDITKTVLKRKEKGGQVKLLWRRIDNVCHYACYVSYHNFMWLLPMWELHDTYTTKEDALREFENVCAIVFDVAELKKEAKVVPIGKEVGDA